MSDKNEPSSKIGAGHAEAMFRLGLKELRQAAYFPESNVAQPSEYGLYGTRTPGEIAESRRNESPDLEEEKKSTQDQRMNDAAQRDEREPQEKQLERE